MDDDIWDVDLDSTEGQSPSPPLQRQRLNNGQTKPNQQKLSCGATEGKRKRPSTWAAPAPAPVSTCEQVRLWVVPDKEDSDSVHISITLSQASSQQAGSKKVKRVADEDLAATWLLSYPWAKYTGKRTPAGPRYTTCSCCLENNPDVSKYSKGEGAVVANAYELDVAQSHQQI